jgi:hypothetical protein
MEDMTYHILSALSRNLGIPMSIQDLTRSIRRLFGKGYYANAYRGVQSLRGQGLLNVARLGRTSVVSLNLGNYRLIDYLAEMELRRKRELFARHPRAGAVLPSLEACLRGLPIEFALLVAAEKNLSLNRVELLVCVAPGGARRTAYAVADLSQGLSIRIDALVLSSGEIVEYLSMAEHNPIQEMVAEAIALSHPQSFWALLEEAVAAGRNVRVAKSVSLAKMGRTDLTYNLGRLGFPLLGGASQGEPASIESTITAALMTADSRIRSGASVVLSKNRVNPRLLSFLALKYGVDQDLLQLLGSLEASLERDELNSLLGRGPGEQAPLRKKPRRALRRTSLAAQ